MFDSLYRAILSRATRHQIMSFLLYGSESVRTENRSFDQRVEAAEAAIFAFAAREYSDPAKQDKVIDELMKAMTENSEAYFELGLQAGVGLSYGLREPRGFYEDKR